MNKMVSWAPEIILPNGDTTMREFTGPWVYDNSQHLTSAKLYAMRRADEYRPIELIPIVKASNGQSVLPLVHTLLESAKLDSNGMVYAVAATILEKEYTLYNFEGYNLYQIFLEYLPHRVIDTLLMDHGMIQYVYKTEDKLTNIYKKLTRTVAKKVFWKIPGNQMDLFMSARPDKSIVLTRSQIDTLMGMETRKLFKKYHNKFKATKYPLNVEWLYRGARTARVIINTCLLDNCESVWDRAVELIDSSYVGCLSPAGDMVELYDLLGIQVPDYYRVLNNQPELVQGNPNHILGMLETTGAEITEPILETIYVSLKAIPDIPKLMEYGCTKLAVELYDTNQKVDWKLYISEIAELYDELPAVAHILKTIDTQEILKVGKHISKMSWITHSDMKEFFDNGTDTSNSCAICLGELSGCGDATIKTKCNHSFHYNCFGKIQDKSSCPLCRQQPV
jgi:hypothetical protein